MPGYTMYHSTGEIECVITCPEADLASNIPPGCSAYPGVVDQQTMWMPGGEPAQRQEMSVSVSGMVVSGLPTPSTRVHIEGQIYEVTDGTLELDPSLPGPYVVLLQAPGFLDKKVTIS
jgi:hypothetical protein